MRMGAGRELEKQEVLRTVLGILRMRKSPNFRVTGSGSVKSGEINLEQVAVVFDDLNLTLGIDAATGRILTLSFHGRGTNGAFGEIGERQNCLTLRGGHHPLDIEAGAKSAALARKDHRADA